MNLTVLCLCYLILVFIMASDIIYILFKSKYISSYLFCKIIFIFVYAIIPFILHFKFSIKGTLYPWDIYIDYSMKGVDALYLSCFFSFIGYLFLTLGYIGNHRFTIQLYNKSSNVKKIYIYDEKKLRYTSIIISILGILALFLWSSPFGGIRQLILQANSVRSGVSNVYNPYSFLKRFASLLLISSYAFFTLIIFKSKNKLIDLIFWTITSIFSIAYLLASDGRMTTGFYFIGYVIIFLQSKSKLISKRINFKDIIKVTLFFIMALLIMLKMDDLTYFIRNGVRYSYKSRIDESLIDKLVFELSFVEKSSQVAILDSEKIGLQIINDIGYGLYSWLPSSVFSSPFNRLWSLNTELAGWIRGELPCGFITQGYYDLGLVGIIIFPYIYGKLIKKIDSIDIKTLYGMTIYASIFYSIVRIVAYGMIYDVLQGVFSLFIFILIYFFIERLFEYKYKD